MTAVNAFAPGHVGSDVDLLLDGCLPPGRRDLALAHLAGCDVCRGELETTRSLRGRLRALGEAPAVPAELTARLLAIGSRELVPRSDAAVPDARFVSRAPQSSYVPVWRPTPAGRGRAVVLAGGALSVAGLAFAAAGAAVPSRPVRPLPGTATVASPSTPRPASPPRVLEVPVRAGSTRRDETVSSTMMIAALSLVATRRPGDVTTTSVSIVATGAHQGAR